MVTQLPLRPATPLNLALNDGTHCPQKCVEVLKRMDSRTNLRNYGSPDNAPLREAIAAVDGVGPENIYLANGSGPILKQAIPWLLQRAIKSSPMRVMRHLISKNGYPMVMPHFTYHKVQEGADKNGLKMKILPLEAENGWRLSMDLLGRALDDQDSLAYLNSPNNPTGNHTYDREELLPLVKRFPRSIFYCDEAYVQYSPLYERQRMTDLVPTHPNVCVSRTFSFAYGLAAARIGYLVASPDIVQALESQVTNYRIGTLQEALGVAALTDTKHLEIIRRESTEARNLIRTAMAQYKGIETFDSVTNFILCRTTDGRPAAKVIEALRQRGVLIKGFGPLVGHSYDEYFRITFGTPEENSFLLEMLDEVLA